MTSHYLQRDLKGVVGPLLVGGWHAIICFLCLENWCSYFYFTHIHYSSALGTLETE